MDRESIAANREGEGRLASANYLYDTRYLAICQGFFGKIRPREPLVILPYVPMLFRKIFLLAYFFFVGYTERKRPYGGLLWNWNC